MRAAISTDIAADVQNNRLDLALATEPFDDRNLSKTRLREDEFFVILPKSEKRAPRDFTPEEFARRFYILDGRSQIDIAVRNWLLASGIAPKPAMQSENINEVIGIVAAGLGISVLPLAIIAGSAHAKDVLHRSFRPPLRRTVYLVQRRDKPNDAALRIVRDTCLKFLQEPAGKSDGESSRR